LLSSRPPGSCSETKEYYEVILKESIVFLKTNDKRGTSVFLVKSSLKPCQSNAVITPKVQRGLGSFGTVEEAADRCLRHWSLGSVDAALATTVVKAAAQANGANCSPWLCEC
jgi:hypothetical protein